MFRNISDFNDTTQEVKPIEIKIIEPLQKDVCRKTNKKVFANNGTNTES